MKFTKYYYLLLMLVMIGITTVIAHQPVGHKVGMPGDAKYTFYCKNPITGLTETHNAAGFVSVEDDDIVYRLYDSGIRTVMTNASCVFYDLNNNLKTLSLYEKVYLDFKGEGW